jgi:phosphomethylpyrimidine synthase
MRTEWIAKRSGQENVSQMHYARKGVETEEMHYVANRERLPVDLIRSEVARGRMIIPGICRDYPCKYQSSQPGADGDRDCI